MRRKTLTSFLTLDVPSLNIDEAIETNWSNCSSVNSIAENSFSASPPDRRL